MRLAPGSSPAIFMDERLKGAAGGSEQGFVVAWSHCREREASGHRLDLQAVALGRPGEEVASSPGVSEA
jgi:hypothetical protein